MMHQPVHMDCFICKLRDPNINQIFLCKFEKPALGIHPPVGSRIASNANKNWKGGFTTLGTQYEISNSE